MNQATDKQRSAPAYVGALSPYQAGKPIDELAREFGLDPHRIVKLASNENPLGVPASAREAIAAVTGTLGRYPDPNGFDLKAALSQHYDVPPQWLTLGNGSNDILEAAALALLQPGSAAVYSDHAFAVYRLETQARGARHIKVPARDYGHDLPAMLEAIDADTRLLFIANPNNPTGTFVPGAEIAAFLEQVHARHGDRVTVVLDEAYNEYLDPELRFDSVALVRRYSNLIVSRTFSKAYGLAGLRVGFAIAQPALTDLLNRVRQPFNVNTLAQAAACAALKDKAFLQQSFVLNRDGKRAMMAGFDRLGLPYIPSYGNFVTVKVGDGAAVNQGLLERGVIVRPIGGDGLPQWLRVSIGLPEENAIFLQALTEILGA